MSEQQYIDNIGAYLRRTDVVNYDDHAVAILSGAVDGETKLDIVMQAFAMVRDKYRHSCDVHSEKVACKASEVIRLGHGLCFAKANLLAALLRYHGIPAGFCYEKVRRSEGGFILHGFNAVYLNGRWVLLDARGNNDLIQVPFSLTTPMLAFPPDTASGELIYPGIYPDLAPDVLDVLRAGPDVSTVIRALPGDLPRYD